jgi:alkylhydroperoxidase family enzyme
MRMSRLPLAEPEALPPYLKAIHDAEVAIMRRHFTDAEFLELAMMTGQYIGFGRVLAMLQLEIASCPV